MHNTYVFVCVRVCVFVFVFVCIYECIFVLLNMDTYVCLCKYVYMCISVQIGYFFLTNVQLNMSIVKKEYDQTTVYCITQYLTLHLS